MEDAKTEQGDAKEEVKKPETSEKPKISIILKTPKEKQTIEVEEDAKVEDIKATAAEKFAADPEYLCLIFAGKLMEDSETLETHNIKDGMTIHLIIKTAPREPEEGPQRPPADISQTPYGFGTIGGLAGLESLGMGAANFMELQNRLQTELIQNPELLKRVLENPLVNSMMGDIEHMKKLLVSNPQMKDLISRHPEIKFMLNNPELLKQTAELAKNPSMLQELMRGVDGGSQDEMEGNAYQTLPSVYNAFQAPSLAAAQEKVAQAQQRNDAAGIFNNPQMSSLLQQMAENPQVVQNMLEAPYTQTMLQALAADPNMATALVNENPWYQGNPALQKYVASMMPQLVNQLQNPEILNMMANPQAVNALLHIQEGMEQLRNAAPALVGNIGLGPFGDFTASDRSETPTEEKEPPKTYQDSFSQFMSRMITGMSQWDPNAAPEDRFKIQLEYMKAMGFDNEERNLQMLTATFGDINAAVQKMLAQQGGS